MHSNHVSVDVFKRYWIPSFPFVHPPCISSIFHALEIESKSNNHLITFDLLLHVVERSLSSTKHPSPPLPTSNSSLSTPSIVVPKSARPPLLPCSLLNHSIRVVVVTPT